MAINDPRDIPGLVAWYSAQAETGYADGTKMSSWTDLSGSGNHATQATTERPFWQATAGSAGGPAVWFDGSGFFNLPNLLAGATSGEMMMAVKSHTFGTNGSWAFGSTSGASDGCHYPYSPDGNVYEGFGKAAGDRSSFTPTVAITAWRRYNVWSAPNDFAARLDGTTQVTDTTNTVTWTGTPSIGSSRASGTLTSGGSRLQAWIGGVVIFNRKLTTTERADLDAWFVANPSGGVPAAPPTSVTVAGSAANVTVTARAGVANTPLLVAGSSAAVTVAGYAGTVVTGDLPIVVAGSVANVAVAALSGGAVIGGVVVETSTEYANDGYNYDGMAAVYNDPPIEPTPSHIPRAKVMQVHQSMSAPVLVNGRPT